MMFTPVACENDFVLISKHAGVPFHKGNEPVGLVQRIREHFGIQELYPLHRLDSMSSGLLLFARNKSVARELASQFRLHTIEKYYIALSAFSPKKKQGIVVGDMKRGRRGVWILAHTKENPSITQFFSAGLGNKIRLFIVKPHTGRTHQIRVVLKSLGAPILGDPVYRKHTECAVEVDRGYLHSYALGFTIHDRFYRFTQLPEQGIHFSSDAFIATMEKFIEPWNLPWPKLKFRTMNDQAKLSDFEAEKNL